LLITKPNSLHQERLLAGPTRSAKQSRAQEVPRKRERPEKAIRDAEDAAILEKTRKSEMRRSKTAKVTTPTSEEPRDFQAELAALCKAKLDFDGKGFDFDGKGSDSDEELVNEELKPPPKKRGTVMATFTSTLPPSSDPLVVTAEAIHPRTLTNISASCKGMAALSMCVEGAVYPTNSSALVWAKTFDKLREEYELLYGEGCTHPQPSEVAARVARECRFKNPDGTPVDSVWLHRLPVGMALAAIDSMHAYALSAGFPWARAMIVAWASGRHYLATKGLADGVLDFEMTMRQTILRDIALGLDPLENPLADPSSFDFASLLDLLITKPNCLHQERLLAGPTRSAKQSRAQEVSRKQERPEKAKPKAHVVDICRDYNREACKRDSCTYRHICSNTACLAKALAHPLSKCTAK
jgi:hypothetical protein